MPKEDKDNSSWHSVISVPMASRPELMGRQSVRATFRLSENAINAVSVVAVHLGIKQKSLFDQLIEDTEALSAIAREIRSREMTQGRRVQKTFVISRKTLNHLEKISKSFKTPRDMLVECSIQRLLPIIVKERERHRKRKEIVGKIERHRMELEKLSKEALASLGSDDVVSDRLKYMVDIYQRIHLQLLEFVEKGELIEALDESFFE